MAASPVQPADPRCVDLRELRPRVLEPLINEQSRYWREHFGWDFHSARQTILRSLEMQSLHGYALMDGGAAVGYSYFVHEEHKALLGDLFLTARGKSEPNERLLLEATLRSAAVVPGVRRIEGQLLALSFIPHGERVYGRELSVYERDYMSVAIDAFQTPNRGSLGVRFEVWNDHYTDAAAELIAECYRSHVDSRINDQYQSYQGARRFVANTTQYPGCGTFVPRAASIAFDERSGTVCGLCLGSFVDAFSGHITQLCVSPRYRRQGLAQELLRRSHIAFQSLGATTISLTVTSSNKGAVTLYEKAGFRSKHRFAAFVWQAY